MMEQVDNYFSQLAQAMRYLSRLHLQKVLYIFEKIYRCEGRIFIMGNGGSAATASHFALDLVKNTIAPGVPRLKAISLTDHVPLITAWSNDTAYDRIFIEQLINIINSRDMAVGISTSGNSANVVNALLFAKQSGATTIGLLGANGGKIRDIVDEYILAPGQSIEQEEDIHMIIAHIITRHMRNLMLSYT